MPYIGTHANDLPITAEVREYVLDNGLTVWLNEDHNQPKIFGAVVVKAGSKDSPNTGIAHYFEHIMFKGTEHIGTVDYTAEKVFLDRITEKYDQLAATENETRRAEIQKEINNISVLAADYVIPNEFDKLISRYGGANLNAGTSYDYTVYHNTFSPQYIAQWAELNSERLICPVFRMFQSELETVYEEKNRRDDMMFNQAMEKAFELYFHPHPYAYPIIGGAANLKQPSLSDMRRFFEKYYIASNMGVLLSGDFDAEKTLPILSRAFSRIPQGTPAARYTIAIPPFHGREKYSVKIPIPFMKVMAMGFRGVPANHPDQFALDIAVSLLNNPNGTGFLDQLMMRRKLMGAMVGGEALNEAGMLGFILLLRPVVQTYRAAEKLVWREINKIRNGAFSDEMFKSLKQELLRRHITELEDTDSRSQIMIRLFTQGKKWNDYISELKRMDDVTKDDVIRTANQYLNGNYIFIRKKTGKYMKEYLPKPDFAPITPKHTNATSKYARQLEKIPVREVKTRFIDFDNDIQTLPVTPQTALYATANPVNNLFTFKLSYATGVLREPKMKFLADYLSLLGTGKQSFNEYQMRLQQLGSLIHFDADADHFTISASGFDKHFEETIAILGEFMLHVKDDRSKLKTLIDGAKAGEKAFFKSSNGISDALFEYVKYGAQSQYLTKPSVKELKRVKGGDLLSLFDDIRQKQCNVHYCGTQNAAHIAEEIRRHIPLATGEAASPDSFRPVYREPIRYDRPLIFLYNMPDVAQNIVYSFQTVSPLISPEERVAACLFSEYFGGGMSSLIFQEIREFRSYAYQASAGVQLPPLCHADRPAMFVACLATQSDKTIDALTVLEALTDRMPAHPEKMESVIQSMVNRATSDRAAFREISARIERYRQAGHIEDPNRYMLQKLKEMNIDDVVRFHDAYIKGKPFVYAIAGNSSKINISKLATFGDVVYVRKKNIYR